MRHQKRRLAALIVSLCLARNSYPQAVSSTKSSIVKAASLEQLSSSLQSVARQVQPAVVQIFNSSYTVDRGGEAIVLQQRSSGSGILVSTDGYIVTNAHVVEGSRRLQVMLNHSTSKKESRLLNARLVGKDQQTDIAVIKIEQEGLPYLTFADSDALSQGQIVLAFGSPLGLDNSVSMGVISAVDRQLNVDDPSVYIQTDAAINPGNSGGPLVNTSGQVVGMNTFILTKSGGSEGVGFAIPGNLVSTICREIRIDHHVHHHQIGISVRAITPAIAQALNLPVEEGVLIEDVSPQSTADSAGLKIGDIVAEVGERPIKNVRQFALSMYSYDVGERARIGILRGREKLAFSIPVVERMGDPQRFEDLVTERDNSIPTLGILGLTVDEKLAEQLPALRSPGGVLVAAKMAPATPSHFGDPLAVGDVIYALNGSVVKDVAALKSKLASLANDVPLVLNLERLGRFQFVVLESY